MFRRYDSQYRIHSTGLADSACVGAVVTFDASRQTVEEGIAMIINYLLSKKLIAG